MNLIIVDDNLKFSDSFEKFLTSELKHNVIKKFNDGNELLDFFNSDKRITPDIVLIDIEMPKLNGILTAKQLLYNNIYLKIIAITMYEDKAYLTELLATGFKGCVFKSNIQDIENALNSVYSNQLYFPDDILFSEEEKVGV